MKINPYLNFNGQCEAAFRFYANILGGELGDIMHYGNSPMANDVPADWHNKVMHTQLVVDDMVLMGSDTPPASYEAPQGLAITINEDDPEAAERIFHALAENGKVTMPIEKTFWAERFGMLTDQFGIPWLVNCE